MKHFDDPEFLREGHEKYLNAYLELDYSNWKKHYKLRELQWFRHMMRNAEKGEGFDLNVPLQYLAIGKELVFAFVPFELLTLTGNKLEAMFVEAGYAKESVFICGYTNVTEGYLAPAEEFEFGGYEVAGSNRWYNISETTPESEAAVLAWFEEKAKSLK